MFQSDLSVVNEPQILALFQTDPCGTFHDMLQRDIFCAHAIKTQKNVCVGMSVEFHLWVLYFTIK